MNIYFTSYGIDTRYSDYMNSYNDIIRVLKNKKVAIIPNAKLKEQDRTNSTIAKEELEKNGIKSDIIDIDNEKLNIDNYDALYLSGGEPKYLMDSIINANLFEDIKRFIDNGGIVIGQSAGAMIFNKIYLDTSTKKLLIMDNGFDYLNKIIVPHYDHLYGDVLDNIPKDVIKINDNDRLIKISKDINNYICKIPTLEEMERKWQYQIDIATDDKENWIIWKKNTIDRFKENKIIPYYGILNGEIICECSAVIDPKALPNIEDFVDNEKAYLYAFRTNQEYQGKGYFSKLFKFMIEDLKVRGYKSVVLGVEPEELKNKEIYFKYGFNEHLKDGEETYPDGTKIKVEYYSKTL